LGFSPPTTFCESVITTGRTSWAIFTPRAYSDYTGYATANTPDVIRDPDHGSR
jgi:hypothetical protein